MIQHRSYDAQKEYQWRSASHCHFNEKVRARDRRSHALWIQHFCLDGLNNDRNRVIADDIHSFGRHPETEGLASMLQSCALE